MRIATIKAQIELDVTEEQFSEAVERAFKNNPDFVLVVRCKDCKYGVVDDWDFENQYLCQHHGSDWNSGEHFCSYGERREGE